MPREVAPPPKAPLPPNPRRPNRWLLAASIGLFTVWFVFLLVLAIAVR